MKELFCQPSGGRIFLVTNLSGKPDHLTPFFILSTFTIAISQQSKGENHDCKNQNDPSPYT